MPVSRRSFLGTAATIGASAAAGAIIHDQLDVDATAVPAEPTPAPVEPTPAPTASPSPTPPSRPAGLPTLAVIALSRLGYGPRPGDVAAFTALGDTPEASLRAYLEQQLHPAAIDDSACDAELSAARLTIRYDAVMDHPDPLRRHPALDETRPLETLGQPLSALWPRAQGVMPYTAWAERVRPADELRVATWIRAIASRRQLQQLLVEFWHNHFNVHAYAHPAIAATMPLYDDLIRERCFGNFRELLEAVAKSVPMMYFLNNVSNKAGGGEGGNENYARELFELHTLGVDRYLKFYDDRSAVGTIIYDGATYAQGYIDRDVYEAARCLSGWTLSNGHWERPELDDGSFVFDANWHDNALKIVLGVEFPYNQGIDDARRVFDLLADHPGTAQHICHKLCRRLIADDPPEAVVDAAVATWMANRAAPDQIAQVLRTVVLSEAFATTWGQKLKRPFELAASYLRATGAELPSDTTGPDNQTSGDWLDFLWYTGATGHKIFEWPLPNGHPDVASYWANTNSMLWRWNLPNLLALPSGGNVSHNLRAQTDAALPGAACPEIVDYWTERLCGHPLRPQVRRELIHFLAQRSLGGDPTQPPMPMNGEPNEPEIITERLNAMVQLLAMTPEFQLR